MTLNIGRISSAISGVNIVKGTGVARNYKMLSKSTSFYGLTTLASFVGGITTKEPNLMPVSIGLMFITKRCDDILSKITPKYLEILKRAKQIYKTK